MLNKRSEIIMELSKVGLSDFKVRKINGIYNLVFNRKFKDYKETLSFVNDIANISEKLNHHPDIFFNYNTVRIKIYTHSHKTITNKDIEFASLVSKKTKK